MSANSEPRTEYDEVNPFGFDVAVFHGKMVEAARESGVSIHEYAKSHYDLWDEKIQLVAMIPVMGGLPLGFFHHELGEVLQVQALMLEVGSQPDAMDELKLAQVFGNWSTELQGNLSSRADEEVG